MRAAIYARVSSEKQEKEHTIGSQVEALRAYAAKNGMKIIEEFTDEGYSGARLDRPALDRMRDLAEQRGFDILLVYCTDRLARKFVLQALILDELERFEVKTIFLEGGAADDPLSKLVHQITGAVAEFERVKITERYRRGKLYRARCGEVVLPSVPFGYVRMPRRDGIGAHVEIEESRAAVVRRIFDAYARQGLTVRQIAKQLTLEAVPTPTGVRQWSRATISFMLRDEAYIGTLYYNRKKCTPVDGGYGKKGQRYQCTLRPREDWIPISVPPIIDVTLFQAAADRAKSNLIFSSRNLTEPAYLLRRLVRCGRCGASCSAQRSGTPDYRYYRCWHSGRGFLPEERCKQRDVRTDLLDEIVWNDVCSRLKNPALIMEAFHAQQIPKFPQSETQEKAEKLNAQIKLANLELSRLLDAYQCAAIDLPELQKRRKLVDAKLEMMNPEKAVLERIAAEQLKGANLVANLDQFTSLVSTNLESMPFEDRQKLLRMVLQKVVVLDWRVDVYYNIPLPGPAQPPEKKVSTYFDLCPTRHGS